MLLIATGDTPLMSVDDTKSNCGFFSCFSWGSNWSSQEVGRPSGCRATVGVQCLWWRYRSGLGCLPLELWSVDCGKRWKLSFTVLACPQIATLIVDPYNTVSRAHSTLEHTDVTVM